MNVSSRTFVTVITVSALLLILTEVALSMYHMSDFISDSGFSIIDPGELLADGATYAGLSIACAVLVAHLLTRPGWWRWVVALGVVTLAVEAPNDFLSFTHFKYFLRHPDIATLPLPLVAIWLPSAVLALLAWLGRRDRRDRRDRTVPTGQTPDDPALTSSVDQEYRSGAAASAIDTGALTTVAALAAVLLLVLAIALSLGGVQLLFGVESEWIPLGNMSDVAVITAVVAGWKTACASRANAAWLFAAVLLSSVTIVFHVGPDALVFPVLVLAALGLVRGHRHLAARARRPVEV